MAAQALIRATRAASSSATYVSKMQIPDLTTRVEQVRKILKSFIELQWDTVDETSKNALVARKVTYLAHLLNQKFKYENWSGVVECTFKEVFEVPELQMIQLRMRCENAQSSIRNAKYRQAYCELEDTDDDFVCFLAQDPFLSGSLAMKSELGPLQCDAHGDTHVTKTAPISAMQETPTCFL